MSTEQKCPIWKTAAEVTENGENRWKNVTSPRAGGKYRIWGSAEKAIGQDDNYPKSLLTDWIVEQNRFGMVPLVDDEIVENVRSWPAPSAFVRADCLLRYLYNMSPRLGAEIWEFFATPHEFENQTEANRRDIKNHIPDYQNRIDDSDKMLAWSGSTEADEVRYLLKYLEEQSWVSLTNNNKIIVEPKGYARLAELDGANPDSSQAFVAMWFDDSMKEAYANGIEPAIRDSGYKPVRIDQVDHIGKIDNRIIAEIRRSRFIVADFTAGEVTQSDKENLHIPRGGVYFEAGFAQGLNIPVIWTCHKDQIGRIHFDTRQFNHITWETPDDLCEQLKNRVGAVIGHGPFPNSSAN